MTVAELAGSLADPIGDVVAGSPDLVAAVVAVINARLEITVEFAPGTFDRTPPSSGGGTVAQVSLDIDGNPATGHRGSDSTCSADNGIIGAEFLVVFGPGEDGGVRGRVSRFTGPGCNQFATAGFTAPRSVTVDANSMRVIVPLGLLGNDDGRLTFKVSVNRALGGGGFTGILDRMSDVGLPPGIVPSP